MIEILCDDSTICKEAFDNDYHRSRQGQTFNMSVKSMRISLDHFIYCNVLYKCKTIFSTCGSIFSIFSIICTVLGNMSKRSLITSVTTVHGLDNQK